MLSNVVELILLNVAEEEDQFERSLSETNGGNNARSLNIASHVLEQCGVLEKFRTGAAQYCFRGELADGT